MSFPKDSAGLDLSAALPTDTDALKADRDAAFATQSLLSAEMLASFAKDAHVCGACHRISGSILDQGWKQTCRCEDLGTQGERWRNRDFATNAELCYCCGAVLLRSGSKFSVWFCRACKAEVTALNQGVGRCVVPIGRHSFMNNLFISGPKSQDPEAIEAFTRAFVAIGGGIQFIWNYAPEVVARNLGLLGYSAGASAPLGEYLSGIASIGEASTQPSFARLLAALSREKAGW